MSERFNGCFSSRFFLIIMIVLCLVRRFLLVVEFYTAFIHLMRLSISSPNARDFIS
jgi:hypothetical protein